MNDSVISVLLKQFHPNSPPAGGAVTAWPTKAHP